MKKQTAVEWLYDTIDNELIDFLESRIDVNELSVAMLKAKEQAKAMEKEQIAEAYIDGEDDETNRRVLKRADEQYYNETYGSDK